MKNIFLLFLLSITVSYSQNEASNWYFGENAGLQFNTLSGGVTPLLNGQLNTREGCASISDEDGNLLFYTDGVTVYNREHTQMMNGNNLYGNSSSTQSAIVVPKPNDPNLFYIFTVDDLINSTNGLNFSIVDMTLDNGLGGITIKNNQLLEKCSEKITAVAKDCNSESVWVITLASSNGSEDIFNTLHAFEVTSVGINPNAVKSTFSTTFTESRGYLKASPDGTMLASANIKEGLYLYNFNTTNGIVSNEQKITINYNQSYPYGIEFSPNNQYLYTHTYNDLEIGGNNSFHNAKLIQFDLLNSDIGNSSIILDNGNLYRGALQLGPNGKIYRSLSSSYLVGLPFLGVIQNPDSPGLAANYLHDAIDLGGNKSSQGLPPFITSFFKQKIDIIHDGSNSNYLALCEGETYNLVAENFPNATYTWYQDGSLLPDSNNTIEVSETAVYEVIIEFPGGNCEILEGEAIVDFFAKPTITNATIFQCDEDGVNDGLTIFNLEETNETLTGSNPDLTVVYYNNYTDANNQENPITNLVFANTSNPQTIYAKVTSAAAGCSTIAEVSLEISTTQTINAILEKCDSDGLQDGIFEFQLDNANQQILAGLPIGLNVAFYQNYNDALLETNSLPNIYSNTIPYSQNIYARVENGNNCYGISEVELIVNKAPEVEDDVITYYCINKYPEYITLNSGAINPEATYTYLWSTGETTEQIDINQTGNYSVEITNQYGCKSVRNIIVETSNIAIIESVEITDASVNNTITVNTTGDGQYEYALFNDSNVHTYYQTSNIFNNVSPGGIYIVSVRDIKNNCGIVEETISVIGFPKFFTPNNDGKNDTWQVFGISEIFQPNTKIKIFDRYGKLLKQINPIGNGWDGTLNGKKLPVADYWFSVTLQDGREYFNHFTLKR